MKEDEFVKELSTLINKYSLENGSDTPDWILAEHMFNALRSFNSAITHREQWYGRKPMPVYAGGHQPKETDQ